MQPPAAAPVAWAGRGCTASRVSGHGVPCALGARWSPGSAQCGGIVVSALSPACPPGRYGAACRLECSCHNNGTCEPTTGACHCSPGFYGPACEHRESWAVPCPAGPDVATATAAFPVLAQGAPKKG